MKKLLLLGLLPTCTWGASLAHEVPVGGSATSGAASETSPAAAEHPVIKAFKDSQTGPRNFRKERKFDEEFKNMINDNNRVDSLRNFTQLLQLGLDPNLKNGSPTAPVLTYSILDYRLDHAFLLLAYGATPDCGRHTNTWTSGKPAHYSDISTFACPYGAYPENDSWEKHLQTLNGIQLLIFFGADINDMGKSHSLMSLLMVGAENGYKAIVEFCLANGADVHLKYNGKTALDMAREKGLNKSGGEAIKVDRGEFDAVIKCLEEHTAEKQAEIQAAIKARKARPIADVIKEWADNNNRQSLGKSSGQRRPTVHERILLALTDVDVLAKLEASPPARRG